MFGLIFGFTVLTGLDCAYITPTHSKAMTKKTRNIELVRTIFSPFEIRRSGFSNLGCRATELYIPPHQRAIAANAAPRTGDRMSRMLCYSYRSATTGSSRAALIAGYIPKNNPTLIETNVPTKIAHSGTLDGNAGTSAVISILIPTPHSTPITPP